MCSWFTLGPEGIKILQLLQSHILSAPIFDVTIRHLHGSSTLPRRSQKEGGKEKEKNAPA